MYPFFKRGGNFNNGENAGVFYFNNDNGGTNNNIGFRAVALRYTKKIRGFYPRWVFLQGEHREQNTT